MNQQHDDFDAILNGGATSTLSPEPPVVDNSHLRIEPTTRPVSSARKVRKGEAEAEEITGPVRVLGFEFVGSKRIRAVRFEVLESGVTAIAGENGSGKSSILQSIMSLVGGAKHLPDEPVHRGEPEAKLLGKLQSVETGRTYLLRRIVTPDRRTDFEVTREDGTSIGRQQEFIDAMTGTWWYRPMAFIDQSDREKAETLRRVLGLDWSALDKKKETLGQQRLLIGRDRDTAEGHFKKLEFYEDAPETEQSASELSAQIAEANTHNQGISDARSRLDRGRSFLTDVELKRDGALRECENVDHQIAELLDRIEDLKARAAAHQKVAAEASVQVEDYGVKLKLAEAKIAEMKPIDTTAIAERMTEIEETNHKVRENRRRAEAHGEWKALADEWDGLSAQMAEIDAEKRKQLAAVEMPVPGLVFNDDGTELFYNEFPLSQASGAEQLTVAITIAFLSSGKLKLAIMDEGERLDRKSFALVDQIVRNLGGQLILTMVRDEDDVVPAGAIRIEDGAVREAKAAA